jgi:uncharacterized protein YdgA (DUF945 family)
VAGAGAAATAVFSARAQTVSEALTRRVVAAAGASGAAQVRQTGYRRGLGRSTQTLTVTLGPQARTPLRLQVTNHIQHGPFPGLRRVAQAVVDTELRFEDAQVQARLDGAFAGKTPRLHTVVGLNGDTDTRLGVPGGTLSTDGDTLTWQPLDAQLRSTARGLNTVADLSWPGFTVLSAGGGGSLRGLSLRSRTQRSGEDDLLGSGQSTLTMEQLSFGGGGQHASLRGVSVSAEGQRSGDAFYDALLKLGVDGLTVDGQTLENLQAHLAARHLARAPLNRLGRVVTELQHDRAEAGPQGTPALSAARQRDLTGAGLALLLQAPVLSIERLSVGEEGQEIVLSAQVTVPDATGLSAAHLGRLGQEGVGRSPRTLAGRLTMRADLSGGEGALRQLLAAAGEPLAGLGDGLDALVEAGYLRRDGERLSMSVRYAGGQGTLNGRALEGF